MKTTCLFSFTEINVKTFEQNNRSNKLSMATICTGVYGNCGFNFKKHDDNQYHCQVDPGLICTTN